MDGLETVVFDVAQAVGLVPAIREYVDADLSTDHESKVVIGKLGDQCFYECFANTVLLIVVKAASVQSVDD